MVKADPITISGATATVGFIVAAGCKDIQLSLVSYKAPSASFDEQTAAQQVLFDSKTQTYSAGTYSLSVAMPGCYYQVDFVYGTPITTFGPAGSNNFYGKQGRLIEALNGGTTSCTPPPPVTPPVTPPPVTPPPVTPPPVTPPPPSTPPVDTPPAPTPPTVDTPPAVTITPASTPQATSTVDTKPAVKTVVKKKAVHRKRVVHKKAAPKKHVKKVTKKAKPARPVVARAHFTG